MYRVWRWVYDFCGDMGILKKFSCWIATLGPVGYLPAPGTCGTLCAVPVMYALRMAALWPMVVMIVVSGTLLASLAVHYALPLFVGQTDPSHIVIDEFVGFAALSCVLPLNLVLFSAGFFLFRFFDIVKPLGIRYIELLPGTWGIMLDDLAAAFYAGLVLYGVMCVSHLF